MNIEYIYELSQRPDGTEVASCCGLVAMGKAGAERRLSRLLVAAGHQDGLIRATRSGKTAYRVASMHAHAKFTISDTDKGFRTRRFEPMPDKAKAAIYGG